MGSDTYVIVASHADTRSFMRYASRCVARKRQCEEVIASGVDGVERVGKGSGGRQVAASPTENAAIFHLTTASNVVAGAECEAERCGEVIHAAQLLCRGVSHGLGPHYGEVLERHYLDSLSVADVAEERMVSKRTVQSWCAIACDWCDSVGARLVIGMAKAC